MTVSLVFISKTERSITARICLSAGGDTPVALILQLMKKEKWTFPADIELEYKVPEGSDAVTEVRKCVQFCKESLA